ncbi:M67 family metallopeptidase [Sphingomonas sp. GB1N7]
MARLLDEAAASPGVEVCGLLFGTGGRIAGLQSCRNVAADPATAFEIDPAQLIAAHRAARAGGPQVVGCYHSHPSGTTLPSERDARAAVADGSIWIIVAGHDVGCWRAVVDGAVHGRFEAVAIPSSPSSS